MTSSKLLAIITNTSRIRLAVLATAFWFVLVFNIERLQVGDFTGVNLSNITYAIVIGMGITMLSFPNLAKISWFVSIVLILAAYAGANTVLDRWSRYESQSFEIGLEVAILLISYLLVRILNTHLLDLELGLQILVAQMQQIPLMGPHQGRNRVQKELRRAARFSTPLACVYCEVYQENRAELSLPKLSDVRSYISYIVNNHYQRVFLARNITMLLYNSDTIVPYRNGFLVFLPQTGERGTARFLSELAMLIKINEPLTLLSGEAHYPEDGNTYDTLATTARSKVRVFTDAMLYSPTESEIMDAELLYDLEEQAEWISQLSPSAQSVFLSSKSDDSKARAGAVFVDIEKRLEIERQSAWVNNLAYQSGSARMIYSPVKRLMDIMLVSLVLPLLVPVVLMVALAVYLDDGTPILFRQERTGYGGKRFNMFKFRTMKVNAAALPVKMVRTDDGEERPVWPEKDEEDPRITRVGRILRKTSLDEIPQLWNVLIGDMSLVGPRPTSWNVDMYTLLQTERLNVKPGITGLWQVSARETKNFDERLLWDVKYVEKISLWLDIMIIWRTIAQVVRRKGV